MFNLAHISDSHQNTCLTSATNLAKSLTNTFCIHTGDIAQDYFEQGVGSFSHNIFAPIIGNHDALLQSGTDPSGYHWNLQPTQTQLYNTYFKNCKLVDVAENTTWWSKEYPTENILILGLNTAIYDLTIINNEIEWLNKKFNYALSKNLSIIICMHYCNFANATPIKTPFTSIYKISNFQTTLKSGWSTAYPYTSNFVDCINSFKGTILCIIGGHAHYDMFSYIIKNDGVKVPYIVIGSIIPDNYNDVSRSSTTNAFSSVVMNLYRYDKNLNTLQIYRLGADGCYNGIRRKMMVWDYTTQSIVSMCSVRNA